MILFLIIYNIIYEQCLPYKATLVQMLNIDERTMMSQVMW